MSTTGGSASQPTAPDGGSTSQPTAPEVDAGDPIPQSPVTDAGSPMPAPTDPVCVPVVPPNAPLLLDPPIPDCPPASPAPANGTCPMLAIDLDVRAITPACGGSGVLVEPLQVPEFGLSEQPLECAYPPTPEPGTWDRSDLPAGACVLRLHGVSASCYPNGGWIYTGSCAGDSPRIEPFSFYESEMCQVAPGCTTPDPNVRVDPTGAWWYLLDRGSDADLVICAPECFASFQSGGACLKLDAVGVGPCKVPPK